MELTSRAPDLMTSYERGSRWGLFVFNAPGPHRDLAARTVFRANGMHVFAAPKGPLKFVHAHLPACVLQRFDDGGRAEWATLLQQEVEPRDRFACGAALLRPAVAAHGPRCARASLTLGHGPGEG